MMGDHHRAIEYAEEGIALYDAHERELLREEKRIVIDHKTVFLCYKALALLAIGRPEEAAQAGSLCVEHSDRLGHAHSRGFSRTVFTMLGYFLRDPRARAQTEDICLYAESQHFANLVGMTRMILGELLVSEGVSAGDQDTVQEGLDKLKRGAEIHSGMEARTYRPFGLGLLALATLRVGRPIEALAQLDAALQVVGETGERWYMPELLRLEGECLWRQAELEGGDVSGAREKLEAACSQAASQRARFWELRACTSLARLMLGQGERQSAHDRLAAVCEGFQADHDLPDMAEARKLLSEMAA